MTPGASPASPSPASRRPLALRLAWWTVALGGLVSLVVAVGAWIALRSADEWELATVLMFGPLRFGFVPLTALLAAAVFFNRRALFALVPALVVRVGPVAGYSVPWERWTGDSPPGPRLRVLTCNMHHAKVSAMPLDRLIDEAGPDVVAIQEWRDSSGSVALAERGWYKHAEPGLFLASRHPIRGAERLGADSVGDRGSVARYELDTPTGVVTVFSLHLATPRAGLGEVAKGGGEMDGVAANSTLRWAQSRSVAAAAERVAGPVVLVGDFNTPPQSAIFRDVWGGYEDAFSAAGRGLGHTFVARLSSVRIDHILVGKGRAVRCWVGPDVGSPHRPVVADLVFSPDAPR